MASSQTFSEFSLTLLLFFFISSLSSSSSYATSRFATTSTTKTKTHYSPKLRAERLIRSFNLFPKDPVNIRVDSNTNDEFVPGKIVEKKFSFLGDSGPSVEELGHHAGYYTLPHSKAARMFYFFFESRNSTNDPVVIWLTGGPGCSSSLALFYENGPFQITSNLSLVWNDYGWDKVSNIIYVDQPTGTGFSYTSDDADIRRDGSGVTTDLYDFLQEFFKAHPEFAKNDFYITGESYAGHYIPALATRINEGNKQNEGNHINLKGVGIGNGLTEPATQYASYPDFAYENKLITEADKEDISKSVPNCQQLVAACNTVGGESCDSASSACEDIFYSVLDIAGDINYYDITKKCEGSLCYDFSNVEKLMNDKSVRDALGVGDLEFVSCSSRVHAALGRDLMKDYEVGIPALLEDGIKVLVYAGELDLICNWLGNSRWVNAMEWSGQKEFEASTTVKFLADGSEAGSLNTYGSLSFLKVNGAGHLVPMDQPKAALEMLAKWMGGQF